MMILPEWLMIQLKGMAIGYAAVASGGLEWWIRKLDGFRAEKEAE